MHGCFSFSSVAAFDLTLNISYHAV